MPDVKAHSGRHPHEPIWQPNLADQFSDATHLKGKRDVDRPAFSIQDQVVISDPAPALALAKKA